MEKELTEHPGPKEACHNYIEEKLRATDPLLLDRRFFAEKSGATGCKQTVLPTVTIRCHKNGNGEDNLAEALQGFLTEHPYRRIYYPSVKLRDVDSAKEHRIALKSCRQKYEAFNVSIRAALAQMSHNFPPDLKSILNKYRDADHEMQRELRTLKHLLED